jgi:hypothetical protein
VTANRMLLLWVCDECGMVAQRSLEEETGWCRGMRTRKPHGMMRARAVTALDMTGAELEFRAVHASGKPGTSEPFRAAEEAQLFCRRYEARFPDDGPQQVQVRAMSAWTDVES